jgi:antitoxin component YwqK of YwqJK toxin-antitoxin module
MNKNEEVKVEYYENGNKRWVEHTKVIYSKNGNKRWVEDGIWENFYKSGKKSQERHYKDGKQVGVHTCWDRNGNKEREMPYKDGKKHGIWFVWNEDGTVEEEKLYDNGVDVAFRNRLEKYKSNFQ